MTAPEEIFVGGGEMEAIMRSLDWSQTSLGSPEIWPQSLQTSISICLSSQFPILLWWGTDLVMFYNDAYRPILGAKHPSMGQRGRDCWAEVWDAIGPMLQGVLLSGEATCSENQLLLLKRHGYLEECYFTFSYSPIADETGGIGGVFTAVTETTRQVIGERRLKTLRDLAANTGRAKTVEEVYSAAIATLAGNPNCIPFALLYRIESDERAHLVGATGLEAGKAASPIVVDLSQAQTWPFEQVRTTAQAQRIENLRTRFGELFDKTGTAIANDALLLPLTQAGDHQRVMGFLVLGISSKLAFDPDYQSFFDLVAGSVETAITNVEAYEAKHQRAEAPAECDRANAALRQSEEQLRLATEAAKLGLWHWDVQSDTLTWTDQCKALFGLPANTEMSYEVFLNAIHPDDRQRVQNMRPVLENGRLAHHEHEYRTLWPDGTVRWLMARGSATYDTDGKPVFSMGVIFDISDRKHIEEELRKNEQQLRSAIEVARFSPYEWNPVTGELIWDARLKAMWGLAPDAEVNLAVHNAGLHPEDREYVEQQAVKAIDPNGDGIFEAEFRVVGIEDGIERWISARGQTFFDAERRPVYYVGAAQDISDRKQAELEIQKFVSLADNSTEFIGMCDMNLIPFYVNEAGLQMVGLESAQQFKDTPVQEFFFPEDQDFIVNDFFPGVLREGRAEVEIRFRHFKTGEAIWMIYNVFYIRGEKNQPIGLATVSRNVTERKRIEAERNQAEATLRANEERFRVLTATIPQLIWTATPDGSVDYLSDQWADYIGLPPERSYDWNWQQVVHPDDLPNTLHDWQHSIQSGRPLEIQHRFRYHTGEWRWQLVRGIPVKDEAGRVTKWVGTCTDIHESELRQQDAQFLSDLSEAIRTIDHADHLMTTANEMIGQYLQLKRCYFAQTDEAADRAWITSDYHDSLPSLVGEHRLSHYPPFVLDLLRSGQRQVSNDNKHDPRTADCYAAVYEPLAIRAHVVVPFFTDGRWAVNLIAATNEPRQWQEREINLLETAAERIWLAVEKLRSEVALRESEDRYRALTELSPQLVFMSRPDGFITYVNQWGLDFTGRSLSELQGNGWAECIHPEHRDRVYEAWMTATSNVSNYDIEIPFRHADGGYRWLYNRALPVTNDASEIEYWIGVAIDITDRKQTEAALQESLAILNTVNEVTPTLIYIKDRQRRLQMVNPATARLLGKSEAELIGKTEVDYLGPEEGKQIAENDCRVMETGQVIMFEELVVVPEGNQIFLSAKAPYRDEQGNIIGLIGVSTDITDRKQAEAEREQLLAREKAARETAEAANRIKDEFLAVLSHELRSPLNPILGWCRLLQNGNLDEAKTKQALATIERNARLQSELIEDLLDVSRILQGKLSLTVNPVNLISTIRAAIETVRLAAEAKSIAIKTSLDPEIGLVSGDSTRLQQVVWNLLSNAVKFTPIGGQVTVQLEQVNSHAQITIRDTGKGISADFLPYVFDYFRQADSTTTRKFGGLGLGLAIVRHLVELHGGTVSVDSPGEGQGATFTVRLPLMLTPSNLNHSEALLGHSLALSGTRILVVDDENDARELLVFLLEQQGVQVIAANSAYEALLLLTQFKPDVLISDIGMPDMDGYMLIQQVRKLAPEQGGQIPAIALTAYAGDTNRQQALATGFQTHISKPVEPEELIHAISSLIKA